MNKLEQLRQRKAWPRPWPRPCQACVHPERKTIDRGLAIGQAPRSVVRRYRGLSRKAVQRHRDAGHHEAGGV